VLRALEHEDLDRPGDPLLDRSEAAFTILEHEAMHQETLLYMWHRLPPGEKRKPAGYSPITAGSRSGGRMGDHSRGPRHAGRRSRFDSVRVGQRIRGTVAEVPAFDIMRHDVTNAAFLAFVESGGYQEERWWLPMIGPGFATAMSRIRCSGSVTGDRWMWRGMFERLALPLSWPVYVSLAEAMAFAKWSGARVPTEAEFQRAAYGTPEGTERHHPWGDASSDRRAWRIRFQQLGPRACRQPSGRKKRVGDSRSGRQRLGVDDDAVRAVCRVPRIGVLSGILGRFF
jgi:hypothetical protein